MRLLLLRTVILISLLLQANFVGADVFRHIDEQGHISYSDKPSPNATRIKSIPQNYRYKAQVKRVIDGDTIVLENGVRIRLIGLNAPEIESRYRQNEQGGQLAKLWLQKKLQQGTVFLEYDQQKKDKYGRSLAHLFLADGSHLNQQLIRQGLARLSLIPPNLHYADVLIKAGQEAEVNKRGLWAEEHLKLIKVAHLSGGKSVSGWQRFLATANQITESRKYYRLILSKDVDVRMAKKNMVLFPDLETYRDKKLEIRGWASRTQHHYSILIQHPSAIIVLN